MWYTVVVRTPFSDEEEGDGERSFEVQAGSPTEALVIANQKISYQETVIKVEFDRND